MIYVSHDLTVMYFSCDTMVALGIVNHDFPIVGQFSPSSNPIPSQKPSSASNDMTGDSTGQICRATKIDRQVCQFPKWNPVLDCLTVFPFTCTSDNNDRMYKWFLDFYGSSRFNICSHQALPVMARPPVAIHLKDNVTPVARHKATPISFYW